MNIPRAMHDVVLKAGGDEISGLYIYLWTYNHALSNSFICSLNNGANLNKAAAAGFKLLWGINYC